MDKVSAREWAKNLRKTLNQKEASLKIAEKISKSEIFLTSKNVMIFYPMKFEIDLLLLLEFKDKNFYLPKVSGDKLLICPYADKLVKSDFKVMEPETKEVDPSVIDIVFVPALCVDKKLNRLGYGRGFYDRLFSNPHFRAQKIAVLNKELVVDFIETDEFDKKVDFLITD